MITTQTIILQNKEVDVLRLDNLHPLYGGNKFFKLELNIEKALSEKSEGVLTFGGAHSNHIYSTAAYCNEKKIRCIGIIRGNESETINNPTLAFAKDKGMKLIFESRENYKLKSHQTYLESLNEKFPNYFIIPEGGNNELGISGCEKISTCFNKKYDYIFVACGTATTYLGILKSCFNTSKVIGISVLKGENKLVNDVCDYFHKNKINISISGNEFLKELRFNTNSIINTFALNGYAKYNKELILFKQHFEKQHNIPLDYIYTSKLFYALNTILINDNISQKASVLAIHTGGLQANIAFEQLHGLT